MRGSGSQGCPGYISTENTQPLQQILGRFRIPGAYGTAVYKYTVNILVIRRFQIIFYMIHNILIHIQNLFIIRSFTADTGHTFSGRSFYLIRHRILLLSFTAIGRLHHRIWIAPAVGGRSCSPVTPEKIRKIFEDILEQFIGPVRIREWM